MAAKKDSAVRKPAAKKTARKRPAKKKGSKRSRTGTSASGSKTLLPPEILADLAVKLARLNTAAPTDHSRRGPRLAAPAFDVIFADALKRAEMLLLAASGKSNEEIHAYQLFTEKDGLMSFEEIAGRFSEYEWDGMKARNTVEPVIEELVIAAELEIQKERERREKLVAVRSRYAGGVYHLADRARRHIRNMINRTGLRDLFENPKQAADVMGQCFFRLMEKNITGDWEKHLEEEYANEAGFESFIQYVCGGLSYEQFISEPPQVWMDLDRLGSIIFFLESLETTKPDRSQVVAQELGSLIRLFYGSSAISPDTMSDLEACLAELKKQVPDTAQIKNLANSACISLRSLRDQWYLIRLCRVLEFSRLMREVCGRSRERRRGYKISVAKARQISNLLRPTEEMADSTEPFMDAGRLRKALDDARKSLNVRDLNAASKLPVVKIRKILKCLRWAQKAGRAEGESMTAEQLRHLLDGIREGLKDPELLAAAEVPTRNSGGTIADEMKRVADELDKGLRMKPPAKRHLKEALTKLLADLRPYSGERKCRPYELFLFASQKRLRPEKLVRRGLPLAPNFIPNPPNVHAALSILDTHRGADLAMGIDDS